MSTLPTAGAQNSTPLSNDNAEFLVELAVTVHKNAIYPSQHPLLVAAVENLHRRLTTLLAALPPSPPDSGNPFSITISAPPLHP